MFILKKYISLAVLITALSFSSVYSMDIISGVEKATRTYSDGLITTLFHPISVYQSVYQDALSRSDFWKNIPSMRGNELAELAGIATAPIIVYYIAKKAIKYLPKIRISYRN